VKKRIVLPGPTASGKGTQAELIQKRFDIPVTSMGAILRKEAKWGTSLGVAANKIIKNGGLAPDSREKTLPVTDFYRRRGILARVDADRGAGSVFDDVSRLTIE
jgi:adenylate kinase family enzyme